MAESKNVAKAAVIMMAAMLAARLLGFVREAALASAFGKTWITDAFLAAFTIPDLMYDLLVGGILGSAFIPVFSEYLATEREDEAWEVASTVINLVFLVMVVCVVIGMFFAVPLTKVVAYRFKGETLLLSAKLTRIMFPAFIILALNGLMMGILNAKRHFLAPAFGAVAYNFCIIVVGVILVNRFSGLGITAFAIGVVAGHVVNFLIQAAVLAKKGTQYKFSINLRHPGVRRIFLLLVPAILGLAASRINLIVNQNFASGINEGSMTALRLASRIMWLPMGVFAGSIAVAVFPAMTSQAALQQMSEFKQTLSMGIRSVFFIIIPASVGLAVLSKPVVRLLFERGQFNHSATILTAGILVFYCIGLFAQSAAWIVTRSFYALQDLKGPLIIAVTTIIMNAALNYYLRPVLKERGLALADSIAVIYSLGALLFLLRGKIGSFGLNKIIWSFIMISMASGIMGVVVYLTAAILGQHLDLTTRSSQLVQVGGSMMMGSVVFMVMIMRCRLEETEVIVGMIRRRIYRTIT